MRNLFATIALFSTFAFAETGTSPRWLEIKAALEAKDHAKAEELIRGTKEDELKKPNELGLKLLDYACHSDEQSTPCKLLFLKGVRVSSVDEVASALAVNSTLSVAGLQEVARVKREALVPKVLGATVYRDESLTRYLLSIGVKPDCYKVSRNKNGYATLETICPIDGAISEMKHGLAKEFYQINKVLPQSETLQRYFHKMPKEDLNFYLKEKPELAQDLAIPAYNRSMFSEADSFLATSHKTWSDICGTCDELFNSALELNVASKEKAQYLVKHTKLSYETASLAARNAKYNSNAWMTDVVTKRFIDQGDFNPAYVGFSRAMDAFEYGNPFLTYVRDRFFAQPHSELENRDALLRLSERNDPRYLYDALRLPLKYEVCSQGKTKSTDRFSPRDRVSCTVIDILYNRLNAVSGSLDNLVRALIDGKHALNVMGGSPTDSTERSFFQHLVDEVWTNKRGIDIGDDALLALVNYIGISKLTVDEIRSLEQLVYSQSSPKERLIKTGAALVKLLVSQKQDERATRLFESLTFSQSDEELAESLKFLDSTLDVAPTHLGTALSQRNYPRMTMLLNHGYNPNQPAYDIRERDRTPALIVSFYDYLLRMKGSADLNEDEMQKILFNNKLAAPDDIKTALLPPTVLGPNKAAIMRFMVGHGAEVSPASLEKLLELYGDSQMADFVKAFVDADKVHNSIDECALVNDKTVYNVIESFIEKYPDSDELKSFRTYIEKKTIRNKVCEIQAQPEEVSPKH